MLYIIGTSHHYQFGAGVRFGQDECTVADQSAFTEMLYDVIASFGGEVLAEEANQQAIEEVGKKTSVVQQVATQKAVPRMFCEPDRAERVTLGIRNENQIRIAAYPGELEEAEVQKQVADSWRLREQEWLRRLEDVKSKIVVFVCGANHVLTFVPLAEEQGFVCKVVHADWQA
jgi:hypothetical protein